MGKVLALKGSEIRPSEPVVPIIEKLEELLEKAKAGEIRCIAYVWIDGGDCINRNWHRGDKYNSQLLGSITDMQYHFMKEWDKC